MGNLKGKLEIPLGILLVTWMTWVTSTLYSQRQDIALIKWRVMELGAEWVSRDAKRVGGSEIASKESAKTPEVFHD